MVNTPIPHSLKSEAKKAAKILRDFSMPNAKTGPDKIIPADTVANAAGLCILSVFRLGFLITARGGSGIVIAKLEDGSWSAPSAIGIAGLGGGLEIGAEVTDFVIILNKRAAVEAFSKGGNLTIGGNFSVAAGPVGRNMEGDIAVRSPAAIYTYSKTKGLFAGLSIEGSYLIERKDANKKFYGQEIRAYDILNGEVERPNECFALYEILERHQTMYVNAMEAELKREVREEAEKMARKESEWESDQSVSSSNKPSIMARMTTYKKRAEMAHKVMKFTESVKRKTHSTTTTSTSSSSKKGLNVKVKSSTVKVTRTYSARSASSNASSQEGGAVGGVKDDWDNQLKARALWHYQGQMPCDLSFKEGDEILVMTRTETQDDWWEGSIGNRIGIFPANFVELMS